MTELGSLIAQRGRIKASLTRFTKYVNSLGNKQLENHEITQLKLRLEKLEIEFQQFEGIQSQIEDVDESTQQQEERISHETKYFELKAKVINLLHGHENHDTQSASSKTSQCSEKSVRTVVRHETPPPSSRRSALPLPHSARAPRHRHRSPALPRSPSRDSRSSRLRRRPSPSTDSRSSRSRSCSRSRKHHARAHGRCKRSPSPTHSGERKHSRRSLRSPYHRSPSRLRCKANSQKRRSPSPSSNDEGPVGTYKLPPIELPLFSGDYQDWLPFFNIFRSVIDKNRKLSSVQKLHYLKSCVKGKAADILKSITLTHDNYKIALSLLQDRYHDKGTIIQQHIKELFDLPKVKENCPSSLQLLLDGTKKNVQALKALNQPIEFWDTILVHLTTSKFDHQTYKSWEDQWSGRLATFEDLADFLEHRCKVGHACDRFEKMRLSGAKLGGRKIGQSEQNESRISSHVSNNSNPCPVCKSPHHVSACPDFLKASIEERYDMLKAARLCFNCLRPYHTSNTCRSRKCNCGGTHNSLLHRDKEDDNVTADQRLENNASVVLLNTESVQPKNSTQVLLSTALINLLDDAGNAISCRALLDCGSHTSFVTAALVRRLGLQARKSNLPVTGIGSSSVHVEGFVLARIQARSTSLRPFETSANLLVLPSITDQLPPQRIDPHNIQIPPHLPLADPGYHTSAGIDVLIGNDLFWDVMDKGHIRLKGSNLHMQNTRFGWILGGKLSTPQEKPVVCNLATLDDLHDQVQKFWTMEEVPITHEILTGNDKACEDYYSATTRRDETGRYIVSLPFDKDPIILGESKETAKKRFFGLERRLKNNPKLEQEYSSFIDEYLHLGHMEHISQEELNQESRFNYLPHHAVVKESSSTTKVRVVFDASSTTSSGVSLNDILIAGPVVQQTLFSILTRFRIHRYVLTADVEKMYRQIWVEPPDTNYQCILWRNSSQHELETYRLRTVTYGTSCAPFLATRTLNRLANDERTRFPMAAEVVQTDFYVDDCLTGGSTRDQVSELQQQLTQLLAGGGFNLRKWCSNDPSLLQNIPDGDLATGNHSFDQDSSVKMLGLMWNPNQDTFRWEINPQQSHSTKRGMLSATARIFDPLGLIGPVISHAKILIQKLWSQQLEWDEHVPRPLQAEWDSFSASLGDLNELLIPRFMIDDTQETLYELHGFSDSSQQAFGGCVYIKSVPREGTPTVHLVASKSRVAPLRRTTLPRLELCGALLLAQLMGAVIQALQMPISKKQLYTDSTIVLGWISAPSTHWQTFVANRVAKIQDLSSVNEWKHVVGEENPADLISRGTKVREIIDSALWWHGPEWLMSLDPQCHREVRVSEEHLPERRSKVALTVCSVFIKTNDMISRYSTLRKLVNVVARCLRYIRNLRSLASRRRFMPFLLVEERQAAMTLILKTVQQDAFSHEYIRLQNNQRLPPSSRLIPLNCFMDTKGLIRVGGRLTHAKELTPDQRNPVVLPPNHPLAKLIILEEHRHNLHAGPQLLLSIIRQGYWLINGLTQVKKVLKTCITCFRNNAQVSQQIMGQLPSARVTPTRPFLISGVDYCGPFYTKQARKRGVIATKSYISVFVCFSTKAVHLELVEDLTADAFIAALRRFIARRGKPQKMYSDNATNFAKASSDLKELHALLNSAENQSTISSTLSNEGIQWEFIPAQSPHMGGLWEAAVKSSKYHLRRTVGLNKLTFCELNTIIAQVEATLNSRPLTPLSQDPNDFQSLTPAHFLIGDSLLAAPDSDLRQVSMNRLKRWQLVQQLYQHFWDRWSNEYLSGLQPRSKWKNVHQDIRVDQLVLIRDDNLPPLQWRMGRVSKIHHGSDGHVRVVTLRTPTGELKRTIAKICPFPEREKEPDATKDVADPDENVEN